MRHCSAICLALLLLFFAAVPSGAQEAAQTELMLKNCKAAYDKLQTENNALKSKGYAAQLGYFEYFYNDYARKRAEIQLDTFMWQARASEILIWVVVVVCLSGVAFSGFQLWRATAPAPVPATTGTTPDNVDAARAAAIASGATDIELSLKNVRITSSVIGLIVLVISVAYLYLFLKEVYAIKVAGDLDGISTLVAASPSPAKKPAAKHTRE